MAVRILLALVFLGSATPCGAQEAARMTVAEARAAIAEGNRAWGKARVAFDGAAYEKMLAPDFYLALPEGKHSRQEFIQMISDRSSPAKLVRFDASVLTVQPSGADWVAVIQEKLEYEFTAADGKLHKAYSLWITRDGWRKTADRWVITYSEAIGTESWRGTAKPPFQDW